MKRTLACVCAAMLIAFAGCEKKGPAEKAGEKIDETGKKTQEKVDEAKEKVEDTLSK